MDESLPPTENGGAAHPPIVSQLINSPIRTLAIAAEVRMALVSGTILNTGGCRFFSLPITSRTWRIAVPALQAIRASATGRIRTRIEWEMKKEVISSRLV